MALSTKDYLNLSALAYIDFNKSLMGVTIKELIERKAIPKDDLNKNPELSALRDSSNPLRSFVLLSHLHLHILAQLKIVMALEPLR
ncbi:MAG: hypothetical protein ACFNMB_02875 [Candidatus Saccharimonas sp.]|jgi:hypothetical protein|nr:hypothetical protein [Candidatus Saccharibacteria bacterium]